MQKMKLFKKNILLISQQFLHLKTIRYLTTMKVINLITALSLSSIGFSQYFNVHPNFQVPDSNSNQIHYLITGEEHLPDSGALHVELLQNTENLELVSSEIIDLSDLSATPSYTTLPNNEFSIDLGSHSTNDYIIHLWIFKEGEIYNETYLNN